MAALVDPPAAMNACGSTVTGEEELDNGVEGRPSVVVERCGEDIAPNVGDEFSGFGREEAVGVVLSGNFGETGTDSVGRSAAEGDDMARFWR